MWDILCSDALAKVGFHPTYSASLQQGTQWLYNSERSSLQRIASPLQAIGKVSIYLAHCYEEKVS